MRTKKDEGNSLTYGSGAKAAIASAEKVRSSTAERSNGIVLTKDDSSPAHTVRQIVVNARSADEVALVFVRDPKMSRMI